MRLLILGVGNLYVDLISNIYTGTSTCLLTAEGLSDAIDILCGVKQGCALSAILFILTIDQVLKAIQRARADIHNLTYADDQLIIEDSPAALTQSIDILVETAAKVGLSLNPKKCHSLHISASHRECLPTSFDIKGTPANIMEEYDSVKYLGRPFGFHIAPDTEHLQDYVDTGKTILNSKLAPWQKIDALKTFLFPSFSHAMRMNIFGKQE